MNACVHTHTNSQTPSTRRRGPGWRIHGSVEDTKLSTNKQHSLSLEWEHLTDDQKELHSTMRESWLSSYSKASHTVLQHWLWRFLKKQTESFAPLRKVFSKIKVDAAKAHNPAPLLTREGGPGSRGTRHLRLLIPKGITGISERDRATLQAWLELVDWTGLGVLPKSQVPRKLKLNMDPMGQMHQLLAKKELQHGVRDH
jgi:hypothetical protein